MSIRSEIENALESVKNALEEAKTLVSHHGQMEMNAAVASQDAQQARLVAEAHTQVLQATQDALQVSLNQLDELDPSEAPADPEPETEADPATEADPPADPAAEPAPAPEEVPAEDAPEPETANAQ